MLFGNERAPNAPNQSPKARERMLTSFRSCCWGKCCLRVYLWSLLQFWTKMQMNLPIIMEELWRRRASSDAELGFPFTCSTCVPVLLLGVVLMLALPLSNDKSAVHWCLRSWWLTDPHTVHHAQGFLVTADISLGLFSGHAEALDLIYWHCVLSVSGPKVLLCTQSLIADVEWPWWCRLWW